MIIKKVGLAGSLALLVSLQGCGGGGDSEKAKIAATIEPSSSVEESSKKLGALAVEKTVYTLKEKLEIFPEYNATTTYNYTGGFMATAKTVTTTGVMIDKSYAYDVDNNVLDVKVKNLLGEMELTQKATFENGKGTKSVDLARNDKQVYLYNTFDPITYYDNVRVVENMTDIEMELFNVKKYAYTGENMTTLRVGYQDSLESSFVEESSYAYTYDDGLKIDGVAVNFDHTFVYSDDNKTVTEMADGVMLRKYIFNVQD